MKAIVLACLFGSAAGAAVVTGTITYSSSFKLGFPIDAAFNVLPSVANIWSWTGPADGTPILVDIDGDGVMDTNDPKVKVVITDMQIRDMLLTSSTNVGAEITDSSGPRWFLSGVLYNTTGLPRVGPQDVHLTTPIVLPVGSDLSVNGIGYTPTVTLIGRVQNL